MAVVSNIIPVKPVSLRSMPIGYDRHGNSYWLLPAQEVTPIFPFNRTGKVDGVSFRKFSIENTNSSTAVEPCVLIRRPNGWWGFHSGRAMLQLVNTFALDIPCERMLRQTLIDRYSYIRYALMQNTLKMKSIMQEQWIDRRIACAHALEKLDLPLVLEQELGQGQGQDGNRYIQVNKNIQTVYTVLVCTIHTIYTLPPIHTTHTLPSIYIQKRLRCMEVAWARCVEVRSNLHYANIYRHEDDPAYAIGMLITVRPPRF